MKRLVLIFCFLGLIVLPAFGQCVADAGESVHRCSRDSIVHLGGSPTAIVGTAPYTYEWTIDPIPTGLQSVPYIYASNMLNDTSAANPDFIYNGSYLQDSMVFFLKVTDNNGCKSYDTVAVTTSLFGIHLSSWNFFINEGDSVFLNFTPNIGSGYGQTDYLWNPTHGLSDSTLASGFWAKPDSSISYTATVTDSKGCVRTAQEPTYHIYLNSSGLIENYLSNEFISLYPNPFDGILQIQSDEENISNITIYSNDGTKQFQQEGNPKFLNLENLSSGIYVMEVQLNNGKVIQMKIIKK